MRSTLPSDGLFEGNPAWSHNLTAFRMTILTNITTYLNAVARSFAPVIRPDAGAEVRTHLMDGISRLSVLV